MYCLCGVQLLAQRHALEIDFVSCTWVSQMHTQTAAVCAYAMLLTVAHSVSHNITVKLVRIGVLRPNTVLLWQRVN